MPRLILQNANGSVGQPGLEPAPILPSGSAWTGVGRARLWLLAPLLLTGCFVPGGGWTLRTGWDFRTCRKPALLYLEMVDTRWDEWNRVAQANQGIPVTGEVVTVAPAAVSEPPDSYAPAGDANDRPSTNGGTVPEPLSPPLNRSNPPVPGVQEDGVTGPTAIRTSANLPLREAPTANSASSGFVALPPARPQGELRTQQEQRADADRASAADRNMDDEDEAESDTEYQNDAEGPQLNSSARSRKSRILQASGSSSRDSTSRTTATRESEAQESTRSESVESKPRKKLPPGAWLFRRPGK